MLWPHLGSNQGLADYESGGATTGMQLLADGKILVRGTAATGNGNFAPSCAIRFLANGTPDSTFGTNGLRVLDILNGVQSQALHSLLVLPNGQWIAAVATFNFYFKKYGDLLNFPHISQTGTILTTTGTGSYQWFLDEAAVSGAINQTFIPNQNGNYTVMITDANGCQGLSSVFNVTNLNITVNSLDKRVTIFPSPTTGIVTILSENETIDKLEILDILGKKILTKSGNSAQIDISEMANGIYIFKVYSGANVIQKKIIKH